MNIEVDEVKCYQPKFRRWINSENWDSIANKLLDTDIAIIEKVMNAKKDGDCSWIVWKNCDYVLDRIRNINKKIKSN